MYLFHQSNNVNNHHHSSHHHRPQHIHRHHSSSAGQVNRCRRGLAVLHTDLALANDRARQLAAQTLLTNAIAANRPGAIALLHTIAVNRAAQMRRTALIHHCRAQTARVAAHTPNVDVFVQRHRVVVERIVGRRFGVVQHHRCLVEFVFGRRQHTILVDTRIR